MAVDRPARRHVAAWLTLVVALVGCAGPTASGPLANATAAGPGGSGAPARTGARPGTTGEPALTPPGNASSDGCGFLTAADIEAVTGFSVNSSDPGPQFGIFPAGCEWELTNPESVVPPTIGLGIMTTGGRTYYDTYFAPYNSENGYATVENLGDDAVLGEVEEVLVVSGDTFFNLQWLSGEFETSDTIPVELARKLVANLGG